MPSEWEIFLDECYREIAKRKVVLDIGSGPPFHKIAQKYKPLFLGRYYALDYLTEVKPHIVGDIHSLPFKDESIDGIICNAVLEHIPEPQKAVREMHRVLQKGGEAFVYVPFLHPYHGSKGYGDYYRFTKDAIEYMFRDFSQVKMARVRHYLGVINLFLPLTPKKSGIANFLDKHVVRKRAPNFTSGYNIMATK